MWKYVRWKHFTRVQICFTYIRKHECPVEAIYADVDVPEKWEYYTPLNAEKCEEYPVILEAKDPLPTARTLEEIQAAEG